MHVMNTDIVGVPILPKIGKLGKKVRRVSEEKFTKNQLIREIHGMWKFNYTLASDEVFRTLIQLVRNAPDELFKKEGE